MIHRHFWDLLACFDLKNKYDFIDSIIINFDEIKNAHIILEYANAKEKLLWSKENLFWSKDKVFERIETKEGKKEVLIDSIYMMDYMIYAIVVYRNGIKS
jgi:hypothetical protein